MKGNTGDSKTYVNDGLRGLVYNNELFRVELSNRECRIVVGDFCNKVASNSLTLGYKGVKAVFVFDKRVKVLYDDWICNCYSDIRAVVESGTSLDVVRALYQSRVPIEYANDRDANYYEFCAKTLECTERIEPKYDTLERFIKEYKSVMLEELTDEDNEWEWTYGERDILKAALSGTLSEVEYNELRSWNHYATSIYLSVGGKDEDIVRLYIDKLKKAIKEKEEDGEYDEEDEEDDEDE